MNLRTMAGALGSLLSLVSASTAGLPDGWRFASVLPHGNDLLAGWAAAPDDLYVGGEGGTILRWDGAAWQLQPTPTQKTVFAMHGTSSSDIWAVVVDAYAEDVGDRALILHYDGQRWSEVPAPDFLGHRYVLNGVFALAPDEVWATLDGSTRPIRFDGTRWEWEDPAPGVWAQLEGSLKGVGAVDAGHVFFFGTHGKIVHRAGDQWALEHKTETGGFTVNLLQCIWAPALDGVLVGGNYGQVYRRNTDGTWTDLGQGPAQGSNLRHIWGRSPGEIYLMGGDLIRRFDGTGEPEVLQMGGRIAGYWRGGVGVGDRLFGFGSGVVHAFLPDEGAGVVSFLTAGGGVAPYAQIDGLAALDGGSMIGWGDTSYFDADPLFLVTEAGFAPFPSRPPGMLQRTRITAVHAGGTGDLLVCWNNWSQPGQGVHRWTGSEWLPMMDGAFDPGTGFTYPPVHAHALWRAPSGEYFAAESGRLLRSDADGVWHTLLEITFDAEPARVLTAVWGRSAGEVYVGTAQGVILRHDGSGFSEEPVPGAGPIRALGGDAAHAYAAGVDGGIWHRDGTMWRRVYGVADREGDDFTAIVAGRNGIFAHQQTPSRYIGGGLGRLWKLEGPQARRWISGISGGNESVLGVDGDCYVHLVRGVHHRITDRPRCPSRGGGASATRVWMPRLTRPSKATSNFARHGTSFARPRRRS